MTWQNRISIDPDVLVGKPTIKGTRLAVDFIIELLSQGWSNDDILRNYPGISVANRYACLSYASAALKSERVYSLQIWSVRLLADESFPGDIVQALRQKGHDVFWVRMEAPGIPDPEVLSLAQEDSRILMTFDKDFGELAFRRRLPASCGIILFRVPLVPRSRAI